MIAERPSPARLLFRHDVALIVDSGTFSFEVTPGSFDVPDALFDASEPLAATNEDGVYFSAGATYQILRCQYEVWDRQPDAYPIGADDERVVVETAFSENQVILWGSDEESKVPLPAAGHYTMEAIVHGRAASRDIYITSSVRPVTGAESWLIRFWPSPPDPVD